ncbi:aminobutyraldehyde dehydrogenase [Rubrobacter aplysinae]|uniref:aminobutyraldehyde dehydrogenase n=1 Tax=Rubrobacter aplysinae TaxID=909625 RepID=UPI000A044CED|nr:aminobutyraldehyde dehydrogenase [Rubrobacter aplysinae]
MQQKTFESGAFVGGGWLSATGDETDPALNPSTGEIIAEVPSGTRREVDRAVESAREAFEKTWFDTTPAERSRMLLTLADRIEGNGEELARLESMNVGKPWPVAMGDVEFSADNLRFFAGAARVPEGKSAGEYARGFTSMIRREPVGVVASIAPWNYPLLMLAWKIGPALAAGNTVVLKPSELTPLSALRVAELAADIFPPGVFNVLTGRGDPVGTGLVGHPGVDMVSLTGDMGTGKKVAAAAAETVKKAHLELGGKAPALVFDDAEIQTAAAGICGSSFYNSGQDCTAAARVLVHERVYEEFVSELLSKVGEISLGDPLSGGDVDMGPLVSAAHRDKVAGFAERAVEEGASVLAGCEPSDGPGFFYAPSVVADVGQDAEIVRKEAFGPLITVQSFGSDEEALRLANGLSYGLTASVWSERVGRALETARRLRSGTVWVNEHTNLASEMPHGGIKQSGYGNDMSAYSLEDYTVIKHVMAKLDYS